MSITAPHGILVTSVYWVIRVIAGPLIRITLIREVRGLDNIPKTGSAILAFNHQSFFDFVCTVAVMPRNVHFLAAEKFFEHRWWGKIMKLTGQIRVDRHTHEKNFVHDMVERHVKKGTLIGIFPEGTRSPHKNEMLKAFTGVAQFALKHRIPVIPVGIIGTFDVMARHDSKPNLKKIVIIKFGEPLYFREHHHKHSDREICVYVTERVMKEIENLSGKVYPHYELSHA